MTRFYSSTAQPTTLSAACTNVATTIQVTATIGFPAVEFLLALDYGTAQAEVVKVTAVAGTTLTVVRGFDNTTAQSHSVGAAVRHVHTADDFRLSRTHEGASSGVHGAAGAVVGTTDAQALSNKDLTAGTNTFPASLATAANLTAHTGATAAHGATGAVVGTTNTQALSNKDLTAGTNTFPTSLATLTGSQTLTNKTLTAPTISTPTFSGDYVGSVRSGRKAADLARSSTTAFTDDPDLVIALSANAAYEVFLVLRFTGTVNTSGAKWQLVGPAGALTGAMSGWVSGASPFSSASFTPGAGDAFLGGNPWDQGLSPFRIETAGTAGNLSVQWAQQTSNAANLTLKTGSLLVARRVA